MRRPPWAGRTRRSGYGPGRGPGGGDGGRRKAAWLPAAPAQTRQLPCDQQAWGRPAARPVRRHAGPAGRCGAGPSRFRAGWPGMLWCWRGTRPSRVDDVTRTGLGHGCDSDGLGQGRCRAPGPPALRPAPFRARNRPVSGEAAADPELPRAVLAKQRLNLSRSMRVLGAAGGRVFGLEQVHLAPVPVPRRGGACWANGLASRIVTVCHQVGLSHQRLPSRRRGTHLGRLCVEGVCAKCTRHVADIRDLSQRTRPSA
jgi:hypothetical protein